MTLQVRPGGPDDLAALRAMNDAEVPRVNALSESVFARTSEVADHFVVAERRLELAGFCWVLGPGRDYGSENYAWFGRRYERFWYLDRIVVHPEHRRVGVAGALYASVFDAAKLAGVSRVTCEVNVEPPNPQSLALHHRLGFVELERRASGDKRVVMLAREL